MNQFNSLPEKTKEHLRQLSLAVDGIVPIDVKSWSVSTGSLDEDEEDLGIINEVKAWAGKKGLYIYFITKECQATNNESVSRTFADAKAAEKGTRAYARLNGPSSCIYVGSSEKIHQRLKEHLGFGSKSTYSLQLASWATPLNLDLKIHCAKYPDGTSAQVIQALEDSLWAELKPMFGRQGSK